MPGVAKMDTRPDWVRSAAGFTAGTVPTKISSGNFVRKCAIARVEAVLHPITENEVLLTTSTRYYYDENYVPENVKQGLRISHSNMGASVAGCPCIGCKGRREFIKVQK